MKEVTPYNRSDEGKKTQVKRMFDKIAPYYDFLNHFLSLGIDITWRNKAIRCLKEHKPQHILDIATGTGDLAFTSAKLLSPKEIIGVDIAAGMLEIAEKKKHRKSYPGLISFQEGDSESLNFADNRFDAVTVAFGVRNFAHIDLGLSEILRVLKPGGHFVVLEFTMPRLFPIKQLYNIYFRHILPLIGKITSKDPKAYRYLYDSVQAFPDYEKFTEILNKTGFRKAQYKSLTLGICAIYLAEK